MNATLSKPTAKATPAKPAPKVLHTQPHRITMDQACEIFSPLPFVAPAEIDPDSTRQIPSPQELTGRKATNLLGEAQFQVVWEFSRPGGQESDDIIVAVADPELGAKEFSEFMRLYCAASMHDQAEMLGRKDWVELQRVLIGQAVNRPASTSNGSSYQPKIVLSSTSTHVMVGESAAGKKRLTWMGHSGFSLARYLGANGWTGGEACDTFDKIGLPMGKAAIIGGVYAGKGGKRGEPAKVTQAQHLTLLAHLTAFRATKEDNKAPATATKLKMGPRSDAELPQPEPKKQTVTKGIDPKILPPTPAVRKGSKADHEAKLAEAMTKKHEAKIANKRAAVWKGQRTKEANKVNNNVKRK